MTTNLLSEAHNCFDQQDFQAAIKYFSQASAQAEIDARSYLRWGVACYFDNQLEEAISKFERAIKLDPKNALIFCYWGLALEKQGQIKEATELYQKGTKIDASNGPLLGNWGNALNKMKKHKDAVKKYSLAHKLSPENKTILYNWGITLVRWLRKYQEASEICAKASQIDPNDPKILRLWAAALNFLQSYGIAIQKLKLAYDLIPQDIALLLLLSDCLMKSGNVQGAQMARGQATAVKPDLFMHGAIDLNYMYQFEPIFPKV